MLKSSANILDSLPSRDISPSSPAPDSVLPGDFANEESREILGELKQLLLKAFTLYVKAKKFHAHVREQHARDYRLLLEMQADEIVAMKNEIARHACKCGERSLQLTGGEAGWHRPYRLLEESRKETFKTLLSEQRHFARMLRNARELCRQYREAGLAARIEEWISRSEWQAWFLMETVIDWEDSQE